MGKFEMIQKCTIIDKLSADLLLGTVTPVNYGMIINYSNHTLSVGKNTVKIHTSGKQSTTLLNNTNVEYQALFYSRRMVEGSRKIRQKFISRMQRVD
jgi:hypothetical protein